MPVTRKRFFLFLLLIVMVAATVAAMSLVEPRSFLNWLRRTELTIHWQTESEDDIAGFNLYRADSPGGDFIKINQSLITLNASKAGNGQSEFRFVDSNVIRGRTYYYKLAIVYRSGQVIRKGPYAITAD